MSKPAPARFIAVIDIGKTNAKLALVDLKTRSKILVRSMANIQLTSAPYPHADTEGIWDFLCKSLAKLNQERPIEAICCTTHGATAALSSCSGELVLPILDYEYSGPDEYDDKYELSRPDFAQSLTPPLPGGLNLGKQLFWLARKFPANFSAAKWILPYPQYWGFRLSGVAASEITSIGCHADLWNFRTNQFSDLVKREGWEAKFAPLMQANEVLGALRPELSRKLGLMDGIPVYVGIHDSNAALLPHLMTRKGAFAVVSTGTWVVICAPGGDLNNLDSARDSFANIDMFGQHVPSARFMGGREFTDLIGVNAQIPDQETIKHVLDCSWMLLPSVRQGSGPFPTRVAHMTVARAEISASAHYVIVSFYLAMMSAQCLVLAGASGDIIVEGPFASNDVYLQMLHAASGRPVFVQKSNQTEISVGTALLAADPQHATAPDALNLVKNKWQSEMTAYAQEWRKNIKTAQS